MEYSRVLVRYGDLTLKGRNKKNFVKQVVFLVEEKLKGLDIKLTFTHDRMYIDFKPEDQAEVLKRLQYVSGISSYSLVVKCNTTKDLSDVIEKAKALINEEIKRDVKFKVACKRQYKNFEKNSMEIAMEVANAVLKGSQHLHVDVHNPDVTLHIELQEIDTYLYLQEIKALGGFPVGIAGKGILMLSGGIDSPVAGFLAMKQGVEIECLHFESTPLTSIESAQKVIDLVKKISVYAPNSKIKIHFFPFKDIHMKLLECVPESYNITIMRRMMYRIATEVAKKRGALCIINGESVGQVASQTLGSMLTINSVTSYPVIRPVVTYDKQDIIKISRILDTYDISIRPFEDCCTVYVPKSPAIAPRIDRSEEYESKFDYKTLIEEGLEKMPTLEVGPDSDIELSLFGLEVREVLENQNK